MWVLTIVVCKLRWPSKDWMRQMSVPLASRCEAKEWRSGWTFAALRIPDVAKALLKAF